MKQFIQTLDTCIAAVGKPDSDHFNVFCFKDRKVVCHNHQFTIIAPVETNPEISGFFRAEEFLKILKKMGDHTDILNVPEGLQLSNGRTKVKVKFVQGNEYLKTILTQIPNDQLFQPVLDEDYGSELEKCLFTNKTPLNGIYFTGNNLLATDSSRICISRIKTTVPGDIHLSNDSIKQIIGFGKITGICALQGTTKNAIYFRNDRGQTLICQSLDTSSYPKKPLMELTERYYTANGKVLLFPEDMALSLDRFAILGLGSKNFAVDFHIEGDKATFSASSDSMSMEDSVTLQKPTELKISGVVDCGFVAWAAKNTSACYFYEDGMKKVLLFRDENLLNIVGVEKKV